MARKPRIHRPGSMYHVMLRGNRGQQIFYDDVDRILFCKLMQEGIERFGHRIYGFSLMSNHVHVLIRIGEESLSKIMQNLSFRYARHINQRKKQFGHVFQGRFKSILVQEDLYLKELIRYIHLNPVRAGLVRKPEDYFWSGHRTLLGFDSFKWLDADYILSAFGSNRLLAIETYMDYIHLGIEKKVDKLLKNGSHEGRILGDDAFAENELSVERKLYVTRISQVRLDHLINAISEYFEIPSNDLLGPSRERKISTIRGILALMVKEYSHLSLTELASLMKRDLSGLSRLAKKTEAELKNNHELKEKYVHLKADLSNKSISQA
jgi:putative transposase